VLQTDQVLFLLLKAVQVRSGYWCLGDTDDSVVGYVDDRILLEGDWRDLLYRALAQELPRLGCSFDCCAGRVRSTVFPLVEGKILNEIHSLGPLLHPTRQWVVPHLTTVTAVVHV